MRRKWTAFVIATTGLLALPLPAVAQDADGSWVVVVAAAGQTDLERLGTVANHASVALEASRADIVAGTDVATRLERSGSRAFRAAPAALFQRLEDTATTMLQDVARGNNDRARALGEPLLSEIRPYLPAIGRDADASRNLGNICLFLVRSHLPTSGAQDTRGASLQASECLKLFPDLQASTSMHPPEVVEVLERQRPDASDTSVLSVQGAAGDPAGCVIRINGRPIGATPFVRRPVLAGTYAVQVECAPGMPSRVREVHASGAETAEIVVDGRFDSTLRVDLSSGTIALAYPDAAAMSEHLEEDVARVAQAAGAGHALAVIDASDGPSLRSFDVDATGAHIAGSSQVAEPADAERSRRALASLLGIELPGNGDHAIRDQPAGTTHTDGLLVPGVTSLVLGGLGLGAFGVLGGMALAEDSNVRAACGDARTCTPEQVRTADDLALGADIALGIGAAGVVLGAILLIADPPRDIERSATARVLPWGGQSSAGVAVSGEF
ncbi:MAG: hypothetical protein M3Y87_05870 [Myxococcota bacterium]|nr:hypothetical protein [Myxococcota bacterium]